MSQYYSLENILQVDAKYKFLLGERSNGKSYAVKYRALERAWKNGEKFAYIRRWREDIMNDGAEEYFLDMEVDDDGNKRVEEITEGKYDCISVYKQNIYFAKFNEEGKKVKGVQIGKVAVLTGDTHVKSRAFVGYFRIIFEEVITNKGYIADEVSTFMSLVSTFLRRREGEVYLIGNTLTKLCPFFREWELTHLPKQRLGTIETYRHITGERDEDGNPIVVDIAVEYCANTSAVTKMIFGNKMITSGEWESDEKEHLPYVEGGYKKHLSVLVDDELELYTITLLSYKRCLLLYVAQDERNWSYYDKYDIVITDRYHNDNKFVSNLSAYPKIGNLFKRLFSSGKVCYQDNLLGTTFCTLLNNRKIF